MLILAASLGFGCALMIVVPIAILAVRFCEKRDWI